MARFRAAALGGRSLEMALLIIGVAALGFNLRGPITSVPPVYPELQSRLGLSAATVSLLAATPVICFGVVSAFAAWLSRRLGEKRVLLAAAAAILAAHGATLADVVNIRAYLTDMGQLPEYGKVRAARFTGTPPTVTTVEVSRLFVPGALLEVEVLAIA